MRTTLNLDDDVVALVTSLARQEGASISRLTNDLVRDGLRLRKQRADLAPYEPPELDTGDPLLDVTDVAAALEILDER